MRHPEKLDLRKRQNPLALGKQMKPTQQHRAAVWECMLGTLYAANLQGEVRYFDYDYRAATKFADLKGCDLRTYRYVRSIRGSGVNAGAHGLMGPRRGQLVLWRRAA